MRKFNKIIFTFILFTMFSLNVKSLTCMYDIEAGASCNNHKTGGFKIENDKIKLQSTQAGIAAPWGELAPEILDDWLNPNEPNIVKKLNENGCPENVYVCITGPSGLERGFVVLKSELITAPDDYAKGMLESIGINTNRCYPGNYNQQKSDGPSFDLEYECDSYEKFINKLKGSTCSEDSECDSEKLKEYNATKDNLKSFCRLQLENGNSFDECVQRCLNVSKDIAEIEGKDYKENKCSFSDNLLGFVNNILKWVKYIIPALIIILSILDFIKAIGADKDEEMKKAQQKFMKRLIIAVLIFIIPFILEFILDKMGFIVEGCGIIEF